MLFVGRWGQFKQICVSAISKDLADFRYFGVSVLTHRFRCLTFLFFKRLETSRTLRTYLKHT